MHPATIRQQLVEARAELRAIKTDMERIEAHHVLIVTGKNETERKAQLTIALTNSGEYQRLWAGCFNLTSLIEQLESDLETAKEQRREREWAIRLRLVEALERRGLEDNGRDGYVDGFDAVADDEADAAWESANGSYNGTVPSDHMSGGRLESSHYANQRRPQPTYAMRDDEPPF